MMQWLKTSVTYAFERWERVLFGLVGAGLLYLTFQTLRADNIAGGSALFGMAFFSFFYSNLARFKKFKGLGFEAELWEDKQKEAADLIDRLKSIVAVYTHEIVMGSVMRGRVGADSWQKRWDLFNSLTGQHSDLGQDIDFSTTRAAMDTVMIFDICSKAASKMRRVIEDGREAARKQIGLKFGSPITDVAGVGQEHAKLRTVVFEHDDLFKRAGIGNIAADLLKDGRTAQLLLHSLFGITVDFAPEVISRLETMETLIDKRPLTITPELVDWADTGFDAKKVPQISS